MIDEPLQTNAADPDQVVDARRAEQDDEKQAREDVRADLATYEARRRSWARVAPVFADIRGDSFEVARALGRRDVALEQLREMSLHLDLFIQMWTEGLKRHRDESKVRQAKHATLNAKLTPGR